MYKQETDVSSRLKQTKKAIQSLGNNSFQETRHHTMKNSDSRAVVLNHTNVATL